MQLDDTQEHQEEQMNDFEEQMNDNQDELPNDFQDELCDGDVLPPPGTTLETDNLPEFDPVEENDEEQGNEMESDNATVPDSMCVDEVPPSNDTDGPGIMESAEAMVDLITVHFTICLRNADIRLPKYN